MINDARTIRDNHMYRREKADSRRKGGRGGSANFSKADPSENAPSGAKKGGALSAEQALNAFQSGVWSKK